MQELQLRLTVLVPLSRIVGWGRSAIAAMQHRKVSPSTALRTQNRQFFSNELARKETAHPSFGSNPKVAGQAKPAPTPKQNRVMPAGVEDTNQFIDIVNGGVSACRDFPA